MTATSQATSTAPPRPIRLLSSIDNMGVGGTELNAVRTAEWLRGAGYELSVLCLGADGPLRERYLSAGIPVRFLPLGSLYGRRAVRHGWELRRWLRILRPDVVHSHDAYSNVFTTCWARAARTPAVVASRRWSRSHLSRRLQVANSLAYRAAHCVVANSPAIARAVHEEDGVPEGRIAIVSNFVDQDAFDPLAPEQRAAERAAFGYDRDMIVIVIVARLSTVKDHASLVRALASVVPRWPNLRLLIVGDGPLRASLEDLTDSLGLRSVVRFAGLQEHGQNLHILGDISVLCSLSEGFPNSIVEAMAAARPVVATSVGGTIDAVRDDVTGVLVRPGDPDGLARAIERLAAEPALRERLGREAARQARARYHVQVVLPQLDALYRRLLGAGARGVWTAKARPLPRHEQPGTEPSSAAMTTAAR
ncbi:MAG: glycosyltransferase [Gemmatimonadota bacterium]|nr:glycosyltransferase [Gemmatimonadota bacterium]